MSPALTCHRHPDCEANVIVIPHGTLGSLSLLCDERIATEVVRLALASESPTVVLDITAQPLLGARFVGILANLAHTLTQANRRLLVVGDPLGVLFLLGMRESLGYAETLDVALERCRTNKSTREAASDVDRHGTNKSPRSSLMSLIL